MHKHATREEGELVGGETTKYITVDRLQDFLTRTQGLPSLETARAILRRLDRDGDGKASYLEFLNPLLAWQEANTAKASRREDLSPEKTALAQQPGRKPKALRAKYRNAADEFRPLQLAENAAAILKKLPSAERGTQAAARPRTREPEHDAQLERSVPKASQSQPQSQSQYLAVGDAGSALPIQVESEEVVGTADKETVHKTSSLEPKESQQHDVGQSPEADVKVVIQPSGKPQLSAPASRPKSKERKGKEEEESKGEGEEEGEGEDDVEAPEGKKSVVQPLAEQTAPVDERTDAWADHENSKDQNRDQDQDQDEVQEQDPQDPQDAQEDAESAEQQRSSQGEEEQRRAEDQLNEPKPPETSEAPEAPEGPEAAEALKAQESQRAQETREDVPDEGTERAEKEQEAVQRQVEHGTDDTKQLPADKKQNDKANTQSQMSHISRILASAQKPVQPYKTPARGKTDSKVLSPGTASSGPTAPSTRQRGSPDRYRGGEGLSEGWKDEELVILFSRQTELDGKTEERKCQLCIKADYTIEDSFRFLDVLARGTITLHELRAGLNKLGLQHSTESLYLLMRRYDQDLDGQLSYSEYEQMFLPQQKEYVRLLGQKLPFAQRGQLVPLEE